MKNIYICSPSAPYACSSEEKQMGIENLKKLGYQVTFSKHAFDYHGNVSSSIENRLEDIVEGFTNPLYDVVMATKGGFNSNELLPFIDYDLLKKNKKLFVGMSDLTTLCVNLWQRAEIQTYYGLMFRHFTQKKGLISFTQWEEILQNQATFESFFLKDITKQDIIRSGKMKGKIVGGNLALLCWMLGTNYQLHIPDKAILFLEDDEETNGYYWQMYLRHLEQSGAFKKISGIIFGKVLPQTVFNLQAGFREIITETFKNYTFPIIINADFGHIHMPISIPYGIEYMLEV